ncbi:MAG: hypothetical protein KKA73_01760 [Chloroflexi bacterium]|nr:hypothetical protein [Chloroflexota bacterium]MBU1746391.1 hypothetical protein [Chloroflexota bacterium]MBU1878232.1 hypothetical protein [Chloroflexota bacterium]
MNRRMSHHLRGSAALAGFLLVALLLSAAQCAAPSPQAGALTVVYPAQGTELVGGQALRVTVSLADRDGQPVEGAMVQAELRAPGDSSLATLACVESREGRGRYLADYVHLPLRGSAGTWRVVCQATWGDGQQAHAEQSFIGWASYSERLERLYGFWIALTDLFSYNVPQADNPTIKYWPYDDGNGGMVILANQLPYGGVNGHFVVLDVHWRHDDWPADEAAAADYICSLYGPHHQKQDYDPIIQTIEMTTLRGTPAWIVTGQWQRGNAFAARTPDLIEWLILRCPNGESDWLWTILINTDDAAHLDDLRVIRDTFECAPAR